MQCIVSSLIFGLCRARNKALIFLLSLDGQPLALGDMENDIPASTLQELKVSKWTFITLEVTHFTLLSLVIFTPCNLKIRMLHCSLIAVCISVSLFSFILYNTSISPIRQIINCYTINSQNNCRSTLTWIGHGSRYIHAGLVSGWSYYSLATRLQWRKVEWLSTDIWCLGSRLLHRFLVSNFP